MRHPKTKINLADALGGKIANERPLAVGDVLIAPEASESNKKHEICGVSMMRHVRMQVVDTRELWYRGDLEVTNPQAITRREAVLIVGSHFDRLARLNPDGSKTPLADIYAERVEVGAGSYLLRSDNTLLVLAGCYLDEKEERRIFLIKPRSDRPSTSVPKPWLMLRDVLVISTENITAKELHILLGWPLRNYTLLPPADAWKLLAEMEGNHE